MIKNLKNKLSLKGLTASLLSLLLCGSLTLGASADSWELIDSSDRYNSAVLRITNGGDDVNDWNIITAYGDKNIGILREDEVDIINSSSGVISFETDLTGVKSEHLKSSSFGVYAEFSIYTGSNTWYSCRVDVVKKPLITVGGLLKAANVPASKKAKAVVVKEQDKFNTSWFNGYDSYRALFYYNSFIKGVRVVDTAKSGWVKADKIHWRSVESDVCSFYVTGKNKVYVKSCSIDGIRYKFSANGICGGKYTGWTKTTKGIRRYWKDGKAVTGWTLVGNNWYYIDKNKGRLTGTYTINGQEYTFSKNGVWNKNTSGYSAGTDEIRTIVVNRLDKRSYGGVYTENGMVVILSVDGKAQKSMKKLLPEAGGIVYKDAEYSVYEMEKIKDEITKNHKGCYTAVYIDNTANRLVVSGTSYQLDRLKPYIDSLENKDCITFRYEVKTYLR